MYYFKFKPFQAHYFLKLALCTALIAGAAGCSAGKDAKSIASGGGGGSSPTPLQLSFVSAPVYSIGVFANGSSNLVWLPISTTGQSSANVNSSSNSDAVFTFNGGTFPGTGGTCSSPIGGNCSVAVLFAPVSTGSYSNVVTVNYTSQGTAYTASVTVNASSLPPANLVISDGATYNFNTQVLNTSTDHTFTVTNSGGITATALSGSGLAAPFVFKGGAYPGTGGNCGVALSSGVSCTMVVTYTPTTAATHNDTIQLDYNNGVTTTSTTRAVQGTGQSPANLTISDGVTYNYGNVATGAPAVLKTFTITNSGQTTATLMSGSGLAAPFQFEGGAYPGTTGTCNTSLTGSGNTCTITVTYEPSTVAVHTDTILLDYFDGAASQQANRPIQGTGVTPTVLTISDGPLHNYGTQVVGSVTDKTFTVTYTGTLPATAVTGTGLAAPYTFKGGTYPGTGGNCGSPITANCLIVVTYSPVGAGATNDTIQINYNNGATNTNVTRDVQGTANTVATLTISDGATFNFGNVTLLNAVDKTFTITKGGTTSATAINPGTLIAPYAYKGGTYPGTGGTCSATTITANCTVVVTYTPTTAAVHNATLTIGFNNGLITTAANRAMTGTGRSPAVLAISDGPTYDYGTKTIGTATDKTFTVTNSGWSTASAITPTALAAPYSFKDGTFPGTGGTCTGGTLAGSGTTCTIVVTFTPSAATTSNTTLQLDYTDGFAAQNAQRAITAVGGTNAVLSISDGATYNYGTHGINYGADKSFTVTNTGGSPASAIAETTMAAPFEFKGGAFPGTGGNCTTTIDEGDNCTIVVTFTPTAATSYADTITLEYNDGLATVNATRAMDGVGATITQLAAGTDHTCALFSTGEVKCWGADTYGQLGDSAGFASSLTPVLVSGITNATQISAGDTHTCALLSNNRIWCWGRDDQGQIGNDAGLTNSGVPVQVATYTDFIEVAAGGSVTCGRRSDLSVACWGNDTEGANGNDVAFSDNATPVAVTGLTNAVSIGVGNSHACAVRNTGTARCWGSDSNGQLGNDVALTDQATLVQPTGVTNSVTTHLGGNRSYVIRNDGSVEGWGSDTYGELGDNAGLSDEPTFVTIGGLANATAIAVGSNHGCALFAGGNVDCWGRDNEGQLGDNAGLANQSTPVAVATISNVTAIASGNDHSCAIQTNGLVYCWGKNTAGQLGNNSPPTSQATPVLALGL